MILGELLLMAPGCEAKNEPAICYEYTIASACQQAILDAAAPGAEFGYECQCEFAGSIQIDDEAVDEVVSWECDPAYYAEWVDGEFDLVECAGVVEEGYEACFHDAVARRCATIATVLGC